MPLMPAVLMIEALTQAATLLVLERVQCHADRAHLALRGVNDAKFRRQVVPGDRLRLEVTLGRSAIAPGEGAGGGVRGRPDSWPRRSCCSRSSPAPPTSIRPPRVHPRRGSAPARSSARTR